MEQKDDKKMEHKEDISQFRERRYSQKAEIKRGKDIGAAYNVK